MTNVIELSNIFIRYGDYVAVDNVSLDLKEGEFFALLGPSGCGKSTLLRTIAGFNTPSSGTMLLDGQDLIKMPPHKRPVNMMFQSYALFPHMTVEKNLRYGPESKRIPSREITRRVEQVLEATQLTSLAKRYPSQLSGGQRQRVALARALVMQPRVLLLDEPLGALDKNLREAMQVELKRLQHDLGMTFVIVTHDQEEALVMADRIALMRAGRIEQLGTASELYEKPNSQFVAEFVGKTNFIQGEAEGASFKLSGFGVIKPIEPTRGKAVYAIRPERIQLSTDPRPDFDISVQGTVKEIDYLGQNQRARIAIAGQTKLVEVLQSAIEFERNQVFLDSSIWLNWNGQDGRILQA